MLKFSKLIKQINQCHLLWVDRGVESPFNFNFYILFFILYTWMFFLHVFLSTVCLSGAHRNKKNVLDSLKVELKTAVSHYAGA